MKKTALFWVAGLFFLLGYGGHALIQKTTVPVAHRLQSPLVMGSGLPGEPLSLLPVGTYLYYDRGFDEGFTRYKIFVNIENASLEAPERAEDFQVTPLTASPVTDKETLKRLLEKTPVTPSQLATILQSRVMDKQDIRDLLLEYSH